MSGNGQEPQTGLQRLQQEVIHTTKKNESVISNRVRTEDAAKEIGCAKQYLIERIKTGEWDLGDYVKPKGAQKGTCFVFRSKLDKFLGIAERDESTKLLEDKMDKQEGVKR